MNNHLKHRDGHSDPLLAMSKYTYSQIRTFTLAAYVALLRIALYSIHCCSSELSIARRKEKMRYENRREEKKR